MEGCFKYCLFCVVFYICGIEVSCLFEDVVVEVVQFVVQGVCEINLFGQNVNVYCGLYGDGEFVDFGLLICIIVEIDGVGCICFIILYLFEFSDLLIDVFCDVLQLVNFLYLLVQVGSDCVLLVMKCGYIVLEFKLKICKLCVVCLDILISLDFIVGFFGEIDVDFEKIMKLIEDIGFDYSFFFIYLC